MAQVEQRFKVPVHNHVVRRTVRKRLGEISPVYCWISSMISNMDLISCKASSDSPFTSSNHSSADEIVLGGPLARSLVPPVFFRFRGLPICSGSPVASIHACTRLCSI
ncbi:hypothetical protein KL918_002150 [Ogataea parapolymorpha]|nr:hypothetical protein KL918_002150 [Ogataea parapolymorpha]KAG7871737.1 hypothetical protein KL916_003837 [Ogataea parapolymorpha]